MEFDKYQEFELGQQQSSLYDSNTKKEIHQHKGPRLASSLDDIFFNYQHHLINYKMKQTETEFDRYIEDESKIDKDMNILTAWKNNKSLYTTSDKTPKRILSIPATATSV